MKFTDILKSAKTRAEVVSAVEGRAVQIAKLEGISHDAAVVLAWSDPLAVRAYENAPKPIVKRSVGPRMFKATAAELELHSRAKKRQKRTGQTYPQAVNS